ncbi:hypothetical protein DEU56DRAFT_905775 [Suillus clintonianus]|uniref:uncharacterized protein n=1 Tax=Suillus clintonianus TaxID=1904413 RepID=UPI001B862647|nr:uncharacterized protein DEU56DRAFT_905775 [Suillus clintonianus]KAG2157102.1 hypothetical protein DEU56DRAFT_905775 [Suillus clintonianus]
MSTATSSSDVPSRHQGFGRLKGEQFLCINAQEAHQNKPSLSKRKLSKRLLIDSDEEEFDDAADAGFEPPRVKRSRTAELASTGHEHNEANHDMDVDVDGEVDADEETRFLPPDPIDQHAATAPVAPGQARKKSKADVGAKHIKRADSATAAKKKRQPVFSSDAEDAEVDIDDLMDEDDFLDEPFPDIEEEEFEPEAAPKRGGKAKASSSAKPKTTKVKLVLGKGGKAKGGKEKEKEKEIMIKDERKIPPPGTPSVSTSVTAQSQISELFADDEPSVHPPSVVDPAVASDQSALPPPELKKRKLPTIKKNKPSASTATSAQSQSAAASSKAPPSTDDISKISAPALSQRKAAGLMGAADFDLRDKSVYAELFKGAGGSTPRSGLNRREKEEERRKELNKMRDEAKAKRAEEAKHHFDLQSQADKIAGFEQKLRAHNSMALHPNFLAAKFREEYDKERARLRHHRERSQSATKEEGEA